MGNVSRDISVGIATPYGLGQKIVPLSQDFSMGRMIVYAVGKLL
jgi:hypothetical protein